MATMVKEKRRQEKKTKDKNSSETVLVDEESIINLVPVEDEMLVSESQSSTNRSEQDTIVVSSNILVPNNEKQTENVSVSSEPNASLEGNVIEEFSKVKHLLPTEPACTLENKELMQQKFPEIDSYRELNLRLERMAVPEQISHINETRIAKLEHVDAFLHSELNINSQTELAVESVAPSAPMFEEGLTADQEIFQTEIFQHRLPKVQCMPLEEATRLYGGNEIALVKEMSEREQADVEAGPHCGPEHPLVDLLSTFRSSLRAVECKRSRLASDFDEEEKYRSTLWKIEKKKIHLRQQCACGLNVEVNAAYEHAELLKERLPVAKLKLEGLLREVQESYCHHQHAALLAHCQIEDLISEIIKSNKLEIRNALPLVLQALRMSDGAPEALPAALQRWAEILAGALVDERDLSQLLFVLHHLFRQSRSVRWAACVVASRVSDSVTAARTLGVLDTLLSHLHLEVAVESNEETEEAWEEVDVRGGGGAVSSGTLRERDLIDILQAFPLQELIAKIVLFSHADFKQASPHEWGDASGGSGLLKSCCGVRVLLSVLQRATAAHPTYTRLHVVLRNVARCGLTALACLYASPRAPYQKELEVKITAELEAAFVAGFTLFGTHELHSLPTSMLTEVAARDYCLNFIVGLHDKSSKMIESLSLEVPDLPCGVRLRIVTRAAADRVADHELATIVLDFLLQTGLKRKSVSCKGSCEQTARECVPQLLSAHPYLRVIALHTVADMSQVESLEPSAVSVLQLHEWRPAVDELRAVLQDWAARCPLLLQQLLLQLDYTPHVGLPLPQQLHIASFLCQHSRTSPAALEACWSVLPRLRTHAACWGEGGAPPPPESEPADLFSMAHALLATDWGYSIPLICSVGVDALCALGGAQPRVAVHCLAPVMLMMALAPDSVSLTPKFAELFTILLSCGPSLVQRALGRGSIPGSQLLLRLVLSQVTDELRGPNWQHVFTAWLHALWKVPAALGVLDAGALAARDWRALDAHADYILQNESDASECISDAVRCASAAPLICESLLRAAHLREVNTNLFPALMRILYEQRRASQRIHVDKALGGLKAGKPAEELIIYKTASAVMVAPFEHPAHLTLWRLFFYMYLEKPPDRDIYTPPCGHLFFSGLIKSRVLSQLKKRLQECATYHQNEHESYNNTSESTQTINRVVTKSIVSDNSLLPALTIEDLTGESIASDHNHSSEDGIEIVTGGSTEEAIEVEKRRNTNMAAYHAGAERLIRQYLHWLEEGEAVKEGPLYADIARFVPAQALEEAYARALSRGRPPPSPELDAFPRETPPPPPPPVPRSPLDVCVASIQSVTCRSNRSRRTIRPRDGMLDDAAYGDHRQLLARVEALLKDIENYAQEWGGEVSRIASLDARLWELCSVLRVPRPLPPVRRACANKCKPLTFHLNMLQEPEWCISAGAERGIAESRSASVAGMRRLTRARPRVAQTAAALHTIARRCRSPAHALSILQEAWRGAARCPPSGVAHGAFEALYQQLAERWVTHDGKLCLELLSKAKSQCTPLQQTLCGSLVAPRRLPPSAWPDVYVCLLQSELPSHTIFSYISRFEMHRWCETSDAWQRFVIINALFTAAERFGPDGSASVLIEIIGVHLAAVTTAQELCAVVACCAQLAARGRLPPALWRHANMAAQTHASRLDFDDIGTVLLTLEAMWSKGICNGPGRHAKDAPYMASLLTTLTRALVATADRLTYAPVKMGRLAWATTEEAWRPWISPATALLPAVHYADMVQRFTDCIQLTMNDCPGSENRILGDIFQWMGEVFVMMFREDPQCSVRMNLLVLLERVAELPWEQHQWFDALGALAALKVIEQDRYHEVVRRWCCDRFKATKAETLLIGLEEHCHHFSDYLEKLLKLFTGNVYVNDPEVLREAARVPWSQLTELVVLTGLFEFFRVRSQYPDQMYHENPQALVMLSACSLTASAWSPAGRGKRRHALTQWWHALDFPAAAGQRAPYTRFMLNHLTKLEQYMDPEEMLELLYRVALVAQCDPSNDASTALVTAVWQHWLGTAAPPAMLRACAGLAAQLTVLKVAALVAEHAVGAYLHSCEGGWADIRGLWQSAVLSAPQYAEAGALLAAYVAGAARGGQPRPLLTSLLLLTERGFDFVKNEVIVAVWICFAARAARDCESAEATEAVPEAPPASQGGMEPTSEAEECKHAALALLAAWGQQQRRSILKVVTLQADTDRPTQRHRALVRFADCVLCPSEQAAAAFEGACAGLPVGDVTGWARAPALGKLPRLAVRLYGTHAKYFAWELEQARD